MISVVPYDETTGSEKFKEFLAKPFTLDMLYPVFDDKSGDILFNGWRGKNMVNWYKFVDNNKVVLEFYPTYYVLRKEINYTLTIPKTINEFINDMLRFDIKLYWSDWIYQNFEPKEYLRVGEIKDYFTNLLAKMGKSHELL